MSLFGTPASAPAAGGFSFGGAPAAAPAPAPAAGGFSFGTTPAPAPAAGTTSLFGATAAPAAAAPSTGFSFGATQPAPAPAPASAFGSTFGSTPAAAPAPSTGLFGGGFGATTAPAPAPSAFGGAFGSGAVAPAPAATGSLFGAAPAAPAAAAQPQEITPETRYSDLPEAARKKIDELATEIKRQRAVAEEVRLVNPVRHGLGLQTEIQQLRRDLQAFLNEQEKQKLAMKDLKGDADQTMKQVEVHGQFVVQRMRSDSGLNTVEQLPSEYMWDIVENFEKRLLNYSKEINAMRQQLSDEPLQGGETAATAAGPYGQRARVTPERLAVVIKEQWKTFNQLAGHAAVAHEQTEALRQQYKQQFKADPDPFEAAERQERAAERRLLLKQMRARAPPEVVAAPAPAPLAAAAAPAPAASMFGAAPAPAAGGLFGSTPAPAPTATGFSFGAPAAAPAPATTGFGFGTAAAAPAPAATGFGFGAPAAVAPAPATGGLFGSTATTGFGATPAPATGGLFGSTAPAPAMGAVKFGAAAFGAAPAPAAPAPAATTTTTKKKGKGGRSRRSHY